MVKASDAGQGPFANPVGSGASRLHFSLHRRVLSASWSSGQGSAFDGDWKERIQGPIFRKQTFEGVGYALAATCSLTVGTEPS